jgi:hypothetical protein
MTHGEIFTALGIFRDGTSDEVRARSGWARTNPDNDVALSMRVPLTDAPDAWFMPPSSGKLE